MTNEQTISYLCKLNLVFFLLSSFAWSYVIQRYIHKSATTSFWQTRTNRFAFLILLYFCVCLFLIGQLIPIGVFHIESIISLIAVLYSEIKVLCFSTFCCRIFNAFNRPRLALCILFTTRRHAENSKFNEKQLIVSLKTEGISDIQKIFWSIKETFSAYDFHLKQETR